MRSFEFPGAYYEIMRKDFRDLAAETRLLASWLPPGGSALDLGCGTGSNLRELAELGYRGVGVDQSAAFTEHANAVPVEGVEFVRARAETFTTDERFDLVYSLFLTLNQLPRAELPAVLRRMRSLLKPGGHVLLEFGPVGGGFGGIGVYGGGVGGGAAGSFGSTGAFSGSHMIGHHRAGGVLVTRLARRAAAATEACWRGEETLLIRDEQGQLALYENVFEEAVLTRREVAGLLAGAGLAAVAEYGGFQKEPAPLHGQGPLVVVATEVPAR